MLRDSAKGLVGVVLMAGITCIWGLLLEWPDGDVVRTTVAVVLGGLAAWWGRAFL